MSILTQQFVNIGLSPDDGTGDPARTGFTKINSNFTTLFGALAPNKQTINLANTFVSGNIVSIQGANFVLTTPNLPQIGIIESATASSFTVVFSGVAEVNVVPGVVYYLADSPAGTLTTSVSTNGRIVAVSLANSQLLVLPYGTGGGNNQVLASSVLFTPVGLITSTNVQGAIAQLANNPSTYVNIGANAPILSGVVGQAVNFRTVTGSGGINVTYNSTDVNIDGSGISAGVTAFHNRTGSVQPTTGDYTAGQVTNVPYSGITQADVQSAMNGLQDRKLEFAVNVGGQVGTLISGISGNTLNVKTIYATGGIAITNGSNYITITGGGGNVAVKVTVPNQAARYALPVPTDLLIAYQLDTGDVWTINAGQDPSVPSNWSLIGNALGSGVNSFNTRTGNVVPAANDYTASQITNVPFGSITQTDVQSALNGLATGKVGGSTTVTGTLSITGGGPLSSNQTFSLVNDTTSPGNLKFYGTNSSGSKGWNDLNSAIAGSSALAGFASSTTTILGAMSVTGGGALSSNQTLSLVGDVTSPGNNQIYGTNSSGTKGWYNNTGAEDELTGEYESPSVKVYVIRQRASYAGVINSFAYQTSAGTLTFSIQINGTPVSGLASLAGGTSAGYSLATGGNIISVGAMIQINVTAVSSAANFCWTLGMTKT